MARKKPLSPAAIDKKLAALAEKTEPAFEPRKILKGKQLAIFEDPVATA